MTGFGPRPVFSGTRPDYSGTRLDYSGPQQAARYREEILGQVRRHKNKHYLIVVCVTCHKCERCNHMCAKVFKEVLKVISFYCSGLEQTKEG